MNVLVVGYPYVRERYFATFRYWPEPGGISFLLPKRWIAKEGKVIFTPPTDGNVSTTTAYFTHSHYPVIGGLLKGFMPGFFGHLWRNRRQVDLVYSCSEPTLLTTLLQAMWSKMLGKRHVCFSWENIPYEEKFHGLSRLVHLVMLRLNLALSDGLVCGNLAGAAIHRRYTGQPISVIPMNGIDPELFQHQSVAERPSHLDAAVIYTFVGAIGYRKGIHIILQALPQVIKEVPNTHVIIAGSGEYQKRIDTMIDELGVRDRVTIFPWVEHKELIRLLSISDVFLYPSIPHGGWAEQFGYSMAEASLMELPIISTRSGSIEEVVVDGETGVLVPPDDVDALAHAMIRLGTDAELRKKIGTAGRDYVTEHFSHEVIARKFHAFFAYLKA
jgi:glycosyltransferase involved in cell wall biosynthesis